MYKKLSPGALLLDPAGGSARPRLPFRLALRALAMVRPPLANPGSATDTQV